MNGLSGHIETDITLEGPAGPVNLSGKGKVSSDVDGAGSCLILSPIPAMTA